MRHRITDWDDAYANGVHIAGGADYPDRWAKRAAAFRADMAGKGRASLDIAYGEDPRQRYDMFLPEGTPHGLAVFVHGGFWMRFDKSWWSHLATGPLARGFAVAMPSYTLCPDARIGQISEEVARAIEAATSQIDGPVHLTGHSAGGHLVTRMVTRATALNAETLRRIRRVVSISGVHDLRPLMFTEMNETLGIDEAEALTESPALLQPAGSASVTAWVGAAERGEFLRQNALLANIWRGLGAETECVEEPDRHHFDVIDGLADPDHLLTQALTRP